jgi:hypothetical protein
VKHKELYDCLAEDGGSAWVLGPLAEAHYDDGQTARGRALDWANIYDKRPGFFAERTFRGRTRTLYSWCNGEISPPVDGDGHCLPGWLFALVQEAAGCEVRPRLKRVKFEGRVPAWLALEEAFVLAEQRGMLDGPE